MFVKTKLLKIKGKKDGKGITDVNRNTFGENFSIFREFFLEYINVANNGPKGPRNGKDTGVSLLLIPLLPSGRRKKIDRKYREGKSLFPKDP